MFRVIALALLSLLSVSTAFADARSECADWKNTPPDRSIAMCSEVIRGDPRAAWAYNNRGIAYEAKKDFDRAIADYNKAIDIEPRASRYHNRGGAYKKKGEIDRAIADYNKAIELDPKDADTYTGRGGAFRAKGDTDRAIADYTKAIDLDPKRALAYYNRAVAYENKGDRQRAIVDYRQALAIDPLDEDTKNALKRLGSP